MLDFICEYFLTISSQKIIIDAVVTCQTEAVTVWACVVQEQGNLLELVDPSLGSNYSEEEAMMLLNLALLCTSLSPCLRPNMSSVVSRILGEILVQAPKVMQGQPTDELRFRAFERMSQDRASEISFI